MTFLNERRQSHDVHSLVMNNNDVLMGLCVREIGLEGVEFTTHRKDIHTHIEHRLSEKTVRVRNWGTV